MPVFLLVLGVGAAVLVWKAPFWAAERRQRRHLAWLRTASADDLDVHLAGLVRHAGWERFEPARALLDNRGWTDAALLDALESFVKDVLQEDVTTGRRGRESNEFDLYDAGFVAVREALEGRIRDRSN